MHISYYNLLTERDENTDYLLFPNNTRVLCSMVFILCIFPFTNLRMLRISWVSDIFSHYEICYVIMPEADSFETMQFILMKASDFINC
jgi:hypothetical protein